MKCVIDELLSWTEYSGLKVHIFDIFVWARYKKIPTTNLAHEIIKILPKLPTRGEESITEEKVMECLSDSSKGYYPKIKCLEHLSCDGKYGTCPYGGLLESTYISDDHIFVMKKEDKDYQLDIYDKKDNKIVDTIYLDTDQILKITTRGDQMKRLTKITGLHPDGIRLILRELEAQQVTIRETQELAAIKNKRAIQEGENDQDNIIKHAYQNMDKMDKMGMILTYFSLALGGSPYRAMLMYLANLVTISNLEEPINNVTSGVANSGKSTDQNTALGVIPSKHIIRAKQISKAAMKSHGRENPYYYDRCIVSLGDQGGADDDKNTEDERNILKELNTEGYTAFEQVDDDGNVVRSELYGYPSLNYTTVRTNRELDVQELSRGLFFNIIKTKEDIKNHMLCMELFDSGYDSWNKNKIIEKKDKLENDLRIIGEYVSNYNLKSAKYEDKDTLKKLQEDILNNGHNHERLFRNVKNIAKVVALLQTPYNEPVIIKQKHIDITTQLIKDHSDNGFGLSIGAVSLLNVLIELSRGKYQEEIQEQWTQNDQAGEHKYYDPKFDDVVSSFKKLPGSNVIFTNRMIVNILDLELDMKRAGELTQELHLAGYLKLEKIYRVKDNFYELDTSNIVKEDYDYGFEMYFGAADPFYSYVNAGRWRPIKKYVNYDKPQYWEKEVE